MYPPKGVIALDANGLPLRHGVAVYAVAHEIAAYLRELPDWPCDMSASDLELCAHRAADAYLHIVARRA